MASKKTKASIGTIKGILNDPSVPMRMKRQIALAHGINWDDIKTANSGNIVKKLMTTWGTKVDTDESEADLANLPALPTDVAVTPPVTTPPVVTSPAPTTPALTEEQNAKAKEFRQLEADAQQAKQQADTGKATVPKATAKIVDRRVEADGTTYRIKLDGNWERWDATTNAWAPATVPSYVSQVPPMPPGATKNVLQRFVSWIGKFVDLVLTILSGVGPVLALLNMGSIFFTLFSTAVVLVKLVKAFIGVLRGSTQVNKLVMLKNMVQFACGSSILAIALMAPPSTASIFTIVILTVVIALLDLWFLVKPPQGA